MKKRLSLSLSNVLLFSIFANSSCKDKVEETPEIVVNNPSNNNESKSVVNMQIKNISGNYGGTLNEAKYGKGTPLNGEADIKDSPYFLDTNYYNLRSSQTRLIYEKYQTYQKTMAKSDGIACALMVLNRDGYDVQANNEEVLVNKYEQLNNTNVYNSGVSAAGLKNLFESFDYQVDINEYSKPSGYPLSSGAISNYVPDYISYVKGLFYENKTLMVKIKLGLDYEWKIIVGIDEMNDYSIRDDVFILANPNDILDHKQDGYTILGARRLMDYYMNCTSKQPSNSVESYQSVVIQNKKKNPIKRYYESTSTRVQDVPEQHFYLNSFGSIYPQEPRFPNPYNGGFDNYNSVYFKFCDVYNFKNSDSRVVLNNFKTYNQSWNHTCGLASAKLIFSYYGYDTTENENNVYSEEGLRKIYVDEGRSITSGTNISVLRQVLVGNKVGLQTVWYNHKVSNNDGLIFSNFSSFKDYFLNRLNQGIPIECMGKTTTVGHFTVCIGYDDMGTENIYDDMIIFADPADTNDHYQNGYEIMNASFFFSRFHGTNSFSCLQCFLCFPNPLAN